jgi:hypothetical protein
VSVRHANSNRHARSPNLGRHKRNCTVCSHPQKQEIEADFVAWRSPAVIANQYGLADRTSVYRHAHALGLFADRQRNVRAALERIIERADDVEMNAAAIVSAIQAYTKINANGRWIERREQINLSEVFQRMSDAELTAYAQEGILPEWAESTLTATGGDSST